MQRPGPRPSGHRQLGDPRPPHRLRSASGCAPRARALFRAVPGPSGAWITVSDAEGALERRRFFGTNVLTWILCALIAVMILEIFKRYDGSENVNEDSDGDEKSL